MPQDQKRMLVSRRNPISLDGIYDCTTYMHTHRSRIYSLSITPWRVSGFQLDWRLDPSAGSPGDLEHAVAVAADQAVVDVAVVARLVHVLRADLQDYVTQRCVLAHTGPAQDVTSLVRVWDR